MKNLSNDVRTMSKIETKARRESGAATRCGKGSAIHDNPLWAGAPRDSGASPRETGARAISWTLKVHHCREHDATLSLALVGDHCDVAPSPAAREDATQQRQLDAWEMALCGLINRRCREVLTIGVEKRVERQHSFPESSERRSRHWCDLDDAADVIGHDAPARLSMAHRSHEERRGEPLVHELDLSA